PYRQGLSLLVFWSWTCQLPISRQHRSPTQSASASRNAAASGLSVATATSSAATAGTFLLASRTDESSENPGCPAVSDSTFSKRWFTNARIGSTERKFVVILSSDPSPIALRAST